jgi:hypothetical protein
MLCGASPDLNIAQLGGAVLIGPLLGHGGETSQARTFVVVLAIDPALVNNA